MGRSAYNPDTAGKYLIRKRGEAVRRHRLSLFFYWLTSLPFGLPTAALWLLDRIQGLRYLI